MDTELLETFLEVRKSRHFGHAADKLFVTQAAVSARIKLLERQLSCSLFLRERGNLRTTAEGERLVAHAEAAILAVKRAQQELAVSKEGGNQLSIASTAGLWHYPFAPLMSGDMIELRGQESAAIRALAHNGEELPILLENHLIDIALLYDPIHIADTICGKVGTLELSLLSAKPQSNFTEAMQDHYIYVDWGSGFSAFHAKRFNDVITGQYTNTASLAEQIIRREGGAAYLPTMAADEHLKPVEGAPKFSRAVYAAYRSNNPKADLCKAWTEHAVSIFR